jgi:predicted dehydrogenase
VLIPALQKTGARLKVVASSGGASGAHSARKFGFEETTTDTEAVLADPEVNAVVIATRHDSHARLVCRALEAGKHVFVEKPLAIREAEVGEIEAAYAAATASAPRVLMVGLNRRFAPQVQKAQALLQGYRQPKALVMTVNAGAIPADHWTQDPEVGGGRVVGEGCHFIDLLRFLAGAPIASVHADALAGGAAPLPDTVTISLTFADGSVGAVHYFANGHAAYPKERLEVFCAGRVLQLDNFRKLRGYGWPGLTSLNLWRQDKGHARCAAAFIEAVAAGGPGPIPFEELTEVARISLRV